MNQCLKDWDSPYHTLIGEYIYGNRLHRTVLERQLNKTGVYRSQHQILMFIAKNPNSSQKDIANTFHVSTATIAVSLKKLEKGGYIKRIVDQEDNRFNKICITEKGSQIVESSMKFFRYVEEQMFSGFSKEEMDCLEGLFKRMNMNLQNLMTETEKEGHR